MANFKNIKKGALSKQLQIKESDNIPITLLKKIISSKIGSTIKNPTQKGKYYIKVTRLLKRRVNFALNFRK